jgi:hypothetical protein
MRPAALKKSQFLPGSIQSTSGPPRQILSSFVHIPYYLLFKLTCLHRQLLDYDSDTRMAQLHMHAPALKATHAPIPGRGAAYLEISEHPLGLAPPVEILVSLLMLDILRRGRFGLLPYAFAPPSRLKQAWARLRPRRNTV